MAMVDVDDFRPNRLLYIEGGIRNVSQSTVTNSGYNPTRYLQFNLQYNDDCRCRLSLLQHTNNTDN